MIEISQNIETSHFRVIAIKSTFSGSDLLLCSIQFKRSLKLRLACSSCKEKSLTHKKWLKNQREQSPKLPISDNVPRKSSCHRLARSLMCFDLLGKGRATLERCKFTSEMHLKTSPIVQLRWKLLRRARLKVLRGLSWRILNRRGHSLSTVSIGRENAEGIQ